MHDTAGFKKISISTQFFFSNSLAVKKFLESFFNPAQKRVGSLKAPDNAMVGQAQVASPQKVRAVFFVRRREK